MTMIGYSFSSELRLAGPHKLVEDLGMYGATLNSFRLNKTNSKYSSILCVFMTCSQGLLHFYDLCSIENLK
jgi:hypothetical protein